MLTSRFSSSVELVALAVFELLHTTEDVKVGALTLISSQPLLGIWLEARDGCLVARLMLLNAPVVGVIRTVQIRYGSPTSGSAL